MATKLFFRTGGATVHRGTNTAKLNGVASGWLAQPLSLTAGGSGGTVVDWFTTQLTAFTRRVRDVFAQAGFASDLALGFGWADARGCLPSAPYVDHFDYPFGWAAS